jgi:hypothetical protein
MPLVIIVSVVLAAGLYLWGGAAFSGQGGSTNSPIRFTVLQTGENSPAISDRVNYRITSLSELAQLWAMIYGNNGPTIPQIDFAYDEVIAVFDGSHAEGGYSIAVSRIENVNGKTVITVKRTTPGTGCSAAGNGSAPFQIVKMPKSANDLGHVDVMASGTPCTN